MSPLADKELNTNKSLKMASLKSNFANMFLILMGLKLFRQCHPLDAGHC